MEAKKQVDYLFILPHDGIEYIDVPTPEIIARYRDFIDYGADGVIAAHPHCPQGWEEYKGKPIFYSLGNFLFNSKASYDFRATKPHWYEGLCVVINIVDGKLSWEVVNTKNVNNVRIEIDHDKERTAHNEKICRYLKDKEEYNQYFGKVCKELGLGKEMQIIDKTLHSKSLIKSMLFLIKQYVQRQHNKNNADNELKFLLKNDQRKNLIIRSIKN